MTLYKRGSTVAAPNHYSNGTSSVDSYWATGSKHPRDSDGFTKGIEFVPKARQQAYWLLWRTWIKDNPNKSTWPDWLQPELDRRKAQQSK